MACAKCGKRRQIQQVAPPQPVISPKIMASNTAIKFTKNPNGPTFEWHLSAFVGPFASRLFRGIDKANITDTELDTKLTSEELAVLIDRCKEFGIGMPDKYLSPVGDVPAITFDIKAEMSAAKSTTDEPQTVVSESLAGNDTQEADLVPVVKRGRKKQNQTN